MMTSNELRERFITFFQQQGHTRVESSSLVPGDDPTLLFTNAGMVQFKDLFLGIEQRSYARATSAQLCVRAGGKQNDLENVGYTARHHTLFEMLGNFSFGDYFKREAIHLAWQFLTEVLALPPAKLWVTVHVNDDETAAIWLEEMQIDPQRFSRCDADNFWSMGDTGPCGPCTEIFYDHGPTVAGGPPGSADADGDRYVEIWNLVFMQFERFASGEMRPLPKPSVDTGMGLERLAAVLQGVHNNYDTDLFKPLIQAVAKLAQLEDTTHFSLRVIADHIRSCAFLITDGVLPANEGRGYVLRRIIRRALRHGAKLGLQEPFFHRLVQPLIQQMGTAYPRLASAQVQVERVLLQEEQQFGRTLENGLKVFEQEIATLPGNIIPGALVFRLYDTYGFPVDLTADIARERNLTLDQAGFDSAMQQQRQQSQAQGRFVLDYTEQVSAHANTDFSGYEQHAHAATVIALYAHGQQVEQLHAGEAGLVLLDRTPFYAEGGGQVGDVGTLTGTDSRFDVDHTYKKGAVFFHQGTVQGGSLTVGASVQAAVDYAKRAASAANHSATHLLHAALRSVLGTHVMQKGSLVNAERLRFDFTHFAPLMAAEIQQIETLVNQQIRANHAVSTQIMTPAAAQQQGAIAFFGEKYGEEVRVLAMGDFSMELCGGIHAQRTGDIGLFKITLETGVAAGIRRIEGVTGTGALAWLNQLEIQVQTITKLFKSNRESLIDKINKQFEHAQKLEQHVAQLQSRLASATFNELLTQVKEIAGLQVLVAPVEDLDAKPMRELIDRLKAKLGSAVIVLGCRSATRASLVVGITEDYTARIKASDLVNQLATYIDGKGGGRSDFAQAGGDNVKGLKAALDNVAKVVVYLTS